MQRTAKSARIAKKPTPRSTITNGDQRAPKEERLKERAKKTTTKAAKKIVKKSVKRNRRVDREDDRQKDGKPILAVASARALER
jgi:hypothetical protein